MKKTLFAVALFLISASAAFAVQPIIDEDDYYGSGMGHRHFPYHTMPVRESLENVASGDCPADTCFDGSPILRREGPLAILKEEKVGETRGHWSGHGGRHGDGGRTYHAPTVTMKQTVGIVDRAEYVREERNDGRFTGGAFGLLGLIGFALGPIVGIAVLAASMTTGIMVGGNKAAAKAEAQPKVFEREKSYDVKK